MSSTQGAPRGGGRAIAPHRKKPSAFSGVERRQQPRCQLGLHHQCRLGPCPSLISRQILARRPPCARRLASVTRGGGVPPTRTVVAQIGEKRLAHILTVDRWSTLTSLHKVPHVALKFPTSLRAGGLLSPSDTWLVGRACVRRGFLILGDKSWSDTRDSESGIQSWLAAKLSRSSETSGPARNAV